MASSPTAPDDSPAAPDVGAQQEAIVSCLQAGGIRSTIEQPDGTYGETGVISVTFEYPAITVPDAVTLYLYPTPEAAAEGKAMIDANLLEGDTETQLYGNVVVDDFGTTLQEPEAQEQATVLTGCVQ